MTDYNYERSRRLNAEREREEAKGAIKKTEQQLEAEGAYALMLAKKNIELQQVIEQQNEIIKRKEELIAQWMASQKAMKELALALRAEAKAHPDKEGHPLAHDAAKQQKMVNEIEQTELQRIRNSP